MLDHDVVSRLDVSFIKLLKSDAPTCPNHMTDLRRGKSAYFKLYASFYSKQCSSCGFY